MAGQRDSQKAAVAERVDRINLPKAAVAAKIGQITPQKAAAVAAKAGRIDSQSVVAVAAAAGKVVQTGLRLRLPVENFVDSARTIRRPMVVGLALRVVHFQRLRLKAAVAVEAVDSQR